MHNRRTKISITDDNLLPTCAAPLMLGVQTILGLLLVLGRYSFFLKGAPGKNVSTSDWISGLTSSRVEEQRHKSSSYPQTLKKFSQTL